MQQLFSSKECQRHGEFGGEVCQSAPMFAHAATSCQRLQNWRCLPRSEGNIHRGVILDDAAGSDCRRLA